MAQDLGSAILAGIQGVQAGARQRQQLLLQQQELDLARERAGREERQLGILESDFKLREQKQASDLRTARLSEIDTKVKREGDSLIGDALSLGYYDVNNRETPFKKDKLVADLQGSDPAKKAQAQQFIVRVANHERMMGRLEEGKIDEDDFSFDSLDPQALASGKVIAVGKYRSTGEPGVSTVRGTNEPDDPIYSRDFTDAAKDISVYWRGSVLNRGSTMGGSSAYTRSTVVGMAGEADAKAARGGGDVVGATNRVTTAVMSSAGPILGREGKRAAMAALSAAQDDPEEYRKVLLGITETLNNGGANIQVPSILTAPVDKNKRDRNIVEPKVYGAENTFDPAVIASNPAPSGAGVAATLMITSRSNPVASLDKKIADATSKADKATGDARIAAENELSKLQQQRYDLVNNINVRQFNGINSQLSSLQSDRAKASPDRRAAFDSKISDLTKRRDLYVKAGYRTPSMETDAYKALETNVLSKLEGLTGEQALQLVQDGRIKFSEADMAAMRVRAQEAGVTSNAQVKRLPLREQTALRAIMYSWSENPQERESIRQEMTNLAETGILSMSKKDLDTSQRGWFTAYTDRMRLDQDRAELLYKISNDRSVALDTALKRQDEKNKAATAALNSFIQLVRTGKTDNFVIDDDGYSPSLNRTRVTAAVQSVVPNLVLDTRQAISEGMGKRHLQTLNAVTSTALMSLAKEGIKNDFFNWVAGWGNPSPDAIIGAGTDFGLQRVKAEKDRNGNITGFRVYSARGGRAGRFFTAQSVQDSMDPELYRNVVATIELNELAAEQNKDPNAR